MKHSDYSRRAFLLGFGAPALLSLTGCARAAEPAKKKTLPAEVTIEKFSRAGVSEGKVYEFLEIGAAVADAGSILRGCLVHGGL